jgi:hypothetical protein
VPLLSRPGLAAIPDIRPVPAIVIVHAACVNVLFRDIVPVLATTIAKAVPAPLPWEGNLIRVGNGDL